ncbi:hypothetical protein ABK040_006520 [Willaertia magna]
MGQEPSNVSYNSNDNNDNDISLNITDIITINICGATCSGKSTLAKYLCKYLNSPIIPINQDQFFNISKLPIYISENLKCRNWETVEGMNFLEFKNFIIEMKNFNLEEFKNKKVYIIVEGFLSSYDFEIVNNLFDINIFLNATKEVCMNRRCQRDYHGNVNNCKNKEFKTWFEEIVWPYYECYRRKQLQNIIDSKKPFYFCKDCLDEKKEEEIVNFIVNVNTCNNDLPDWYLNNDENTLLREEQQLTQLNAKNNFQ